MLFEHVIYEAMITHLKDFRKDGKGDSIALTEEFSELTEVIDRTFRPDRDVKMA